MQLGRKTVASGRKRLHEERKRRKDRSEKQLTGVERERKSCTNSPEASKK